MPVERRERVGERLRAALVVDQTCRQTQGTV
jgi:hypothetical protein